VPLVEVGVPQAGLDHGGADALLPLDQLRRHERRHERHHAHAAVVGQAPKHVVRHVAGVVGDGPARRVAEDHRRLRAVEGVTHRGRRDVREVDEHADPVHLGDDLATEVAQPADRWLVGRRVGPRHVVVVGERHVADAEPVQRAQHAERLVDRMAALSAEQGRDPAVREGRASLFRGRGDSQLRRISLGEGVHELGLLDDRRDGGITAQPTRYVHGPELDSDPAGPQPGEICVQP
jgi:hypothetical protein